MPDREQLAAWRANDITDPRQLVTRDWRRNGMAVQADGGREAFVTRHRRDLWSLDLLPPIARNRWGNARQISEDLAAFQQTGRLPVPAGGPW